MFVFSGCFLATTTINPLNHKNSKQKQMRQGGTHDSLLKCVNIVVQFLFFFVLNLSLKTQGFNGDGKGRERDPLKPWVSEDVLNSLHYTIPKQRKIKFEPRMELNHNINTS